jgi:(E)-4-hydroxy-3-methylbut-2-enyl-diphosphate synthase
MVFITSKFCLAQLGHAMKFIPFFLSFNDLESRLEDITENLDIAVIGCYVNGPGESKAADIGVTGGSPKNLIYIDGKPDHKVESADLADHLEKMIREKVKEKSKIEENLIAKT